MTLRGFKLSLLASALALPSTAALAADIRIDGFASVVYGQALDKDDLPASGQIYGYDEKANFQEDSKYGIQFRSDLGDGLSATGQIVGRGARDFEAQVTWAYFSYELTDNLTLHAGRQRIPLFLYSDFIDVGYAYTWIAPPAEVYGLSGFDNLDGVKLEHYTQLGDWTSRLSFLAGASATTLTEGGTSVDINSDNFTVFSWDLTWEWLTVHMAYSQSEGTVSVYNLAVDGLGALSSFLTPDQLDSLTVDGDKGTIGSLGLAADWGSVFASMEVQTLEVDTSPQSSDRQAAYVMLGYRWSNFAIAATYAYIDDPNNDQTIQLLNSIEQAVGDYALEQLDSLYRPGVETEAATLTFRWDFHPSAAFKAEYTTLESEYSDGRIIGGVPTPVTTAEPSLIRLGVDLVF